MPIEKATNSITSGGKRLYAYLSKLTPQQWVVLVIVLLVLIYIFNNYAKPRLKAFWYNIFGALSRDGSGKPDENRQQQLQVMANNAHTVLKSTGGDSHGVLAGLNALTDGEFIYVYEYLISSTGENPACLVDIEMMPLSDEDEKFIARAESLKLPTKIDWWSWTTGDCSN